MDPGAFATAQVPYNPINPSAAGPLPPGSAAPDQERLILYAAAGEPAYSFQGRRCHSARSEASISAIIEA